MSDTRLSIFFSYSHADKPIARTLADGLKRAGVRVWIDEGELRAGDSIIERISNAISEVEFIVALISKDSISSKWCSKELALAVDEGLRQGHVRVLPLRIDDAEMPTALRDVFYIQVDSSNPEKSLERLIADAWFHYRQKHATAHHNDKFIPLSPKSLIDRRRLKRLKLALVARNADDMGWEAKITLVNDRSVPATEILFQAALEDSLNQLYIGYALGGIGELGPSAATWFYKLLTHPDDRVVLDAFNELAQVAFIMSPEMWDHMLDTLEEISRVGDWSVCRARLMAVVPKEGDSGDMLREVLAAAEELLPDDQIYNEQKLSGSKSSER